MNDILLFFDGITLLLVVKILLVTLLSVYALFAGLMMRQVSAMTKAITMKDDFVIRILGISHFVAAIVVLLLALFIP